MQTKTKCMKISKDRNITFFTYQINRAQDWKAFRMQVLGHLFEPQPQLSFKIQNESLVSKLKKDNGYLYRNKSNSPLSCRKRITEAVFLSVLDYGDVIYSHSSASLLPLSLHCSVYHCAFITPTSYSSEPNSQLSG